MPKACQWIKQDQVARGERCSSDASFIVSWLANERKASKRSCRLHVPMWFSYSLDIAGAQSFFVRTFDNVRDFSRLRRIAA